MSRGLEMKRIKRMKIARFRAQLFSALAVLCDLDQADIHDTNLHRVRMLTVLLGQSDEVFRND